MFPLKRACKNHFFFAAPYFCGTLKIQELRKKSAAYSHFWSPECPKAGRSGGSLLVPVAVGPGRLINARR
jgi:hypothetical protein